MAKNTKTVKGAPKRSSRNPVKRKALITTKTNSNKKSVWDRPAATTIIGAVLGAVIASSLGAFYMIMLTTSPPILIPNAIDCPSFGYKSASVKTLTLTNYGGSHSTFWAAVNATGFKCFITKMSPSWSSNVIDEWNERYNQSFCQSDEHFLGISKGASKTFVIFTDPSYMGKNEEAGFDILYQYESFGPRFFSFKSPVFVAKRCRYNVSDSGWNLRYNPIDS